MSSWFEEFGPEVPPAATPPATPPSPSAPPTPTPGPASQLTAAQFIAQYQSSHPPSLPDLLAAMKAAGYNVAPYMYGSVQSGNEITLDGQKYKILSGENTGSPSWYTAGTDDGGEGFRGLSSLGDFPKMDTPAPFSFPDFQGAGTFVAPDKDAVLADPGYQIRFERGLKALDMSASAHGDLRTGGHERDIIDYGQQSGSQEYANVYNRQLGEFALDESNREASYDRSRANAAGNYGLNLQSQTSAYDRAVQAYLQHYAESNNDFSQLFSLASLGSSAAASVPPIPAPLPANPPLPGSAGSTGGFVTTPPLGTAAGAPLRPAPLPGPALAPYTGYGRHDPSLDWGRGLAYGG